jgi:hypothetical protein
MDGINTPADEDVDLQGPPMPSPAEMLAATERSLADIASGRVVPLDVVVADVRAAAARIRAAREAGPGAT